MPVGLFYHDGSGSGYLPVIWLLRLLLLPFAVTVLPALHVRSRLVTVRRLYHTFSHWLGLLHRYVGLRFCYVPLPVRLPAAAYGCTLPLVATFTHARCTVLTVWLPLVAVTVYLRLHTALPFCSSAVANTPIPVAYRSGYGCTVAFG